MALFDLSSSWLEGTCCPLAARGYSRDGEERHPADRVRAARPPGGRPVAARVFGGSTGDPAAFTEIVQVVRDKFDLGKMVMVGDRGMITSARIDALKDLGDDAGFGWVTALRAPQIKKLMDEDGLLQLSLFDRQDLAEISHPDYPGERLGACHNPALAEERGRKREDLLRATERLLAPLITRVQAGRLAGAAKIGVEAGKVISKYKMAKHFDVTITDDTLTVTRKQAQIDAEGALHGLYGIRTPLPPDELDRPGVVAAYKNLKHVERDFRDIKAHVLICILACYLVWHLRQAWAPLTFTDENPPAHTNPVAPAQRSAAAQAEASHRRDPAGQPYRSFRGLLDHLATLARNQVRFAAASADIPVLADPTPAQRQAFELIGKPVPLTLA